MMAKIRVLVAEDHLIARVGVTEVINMQHDMTVVAEATNGEQALALYRKHREYNALLGAAGMYAALILKLMLLKK